MKQAPVDPPRAGDPVPVPPGEVPVQGGGDACRLPRRGTAHGCSWRTSRFRTSPRRPTTSSLLSRPSEAGHQLILPGRAICGEPCAVLRDMPQESPAFALAAGDVVDSTAPATFTTIDTPFGQSRILGLPFPPVSFHRGPPRPADHAAPPAHARADVDARDRVGRPASARPPRRRAAYRAPTGGGGPHMNRDIVLGSAPHGLTVSGGAPTGGGEPCRRRRAPDARRNRLAHSRESRRLPPPGTSCAGPARNSPVRLADSAGSRPTGACAPVRPTLREPPLPAGMGA